MNGMAYMCPHASQTVLNGYKEFLSRTAPPKKTLLTGREKDVLKLTAEACG